MKKVLSLWVGLLVVSANGQTLYNNAVAHGLKDEGLRTGSRPGGGSYSEIQSGNMIAGYRCSIEPGAFDRLADDFSVPVNGWSVTGASLFMYETDATAVTLNGGLFEIRNSHDGIIGGVVSTGRFLTATNTDIYRIFKNQPNDTRRIQKVDISFNTSLSAGGYFFDWAATGNNYKTGPWSPYLTKVGAQTVNGANAIQSINGGLTWMNIQDGLQNQDLPFILYGTVGQNGIGGNIAPEPSSLLLLGGLAIFARKRRKA